MLNVRSKTIDLLTTLITKQMRDFSTCKCQGAASIDESRTGKGPEISFEEKTSYIRNAVTNA